MRSLGDAAKDARAVSSVCLQSPERALLGGMRMHSIIYLVGLVVVVLAILSFLGLS